MYDALVQRTVSTKFQPTVYQSVEEFCATFATSKDSGALEVSDSVPIQMRWFNRKSDTTFVTFSAAITRRAATEVPVFTGWGTTKHLKANVLMISDPSLILDSKLNLAWYVGSESQPNFVSSLNAILNTFAASTKLVLFGASGGGYAALTQAARLAGTTAVVSNPQTDIRKFSYYPEFKRLAWPSHETPHVPLEVISSFSTPVDCQVVYIQNIQDVDHVEKHFSPFMDSLHPSNRVLALTPPLTEGHIGPAPESFKNIFTTVCNYPSFADLEKELRKQPIYSTRNAPN